MPDRGHWHSRLAILWLCCALLCMAWAGQQLASGNKIETNLLALLPATERNPRAEAAVNALADTLGNRAIFLVGHADPQAASQLARRFAEQLQQSAAFRQVQASVPKADPRLLLDFYRPYRAGLLAADDLQAMENRRFDADARLTRRLHQPFAGGLATPLAEDPLGLWQSWLNQLPLMQSRLNIENDQLLVRDGVRTWVLISANLPGSAYDDRVQGRVVSAWDAARATVVDEGAEVLHGGGVFYAEAARSAAEREANLILFGSLTGIVLMMVWLFRSVRPLVLTVATVALGLGCAVAATLTVYGELHLLTLVFGASLIGEAVDYGIQYFAAQLDAGADWEPRSGLRRIIRGLAIALATSLIGYGALALSPFPAIGQITLFAFAGLAAAWISVVLLLPCLSQRPLLRDVTQVTRLPMAILAFSQRYLNPRRAGMLVLLLLLLAIPGWWQLQGDDDIRLLVNRPPSLQAEEARIRELVGFVGSSRFFLIEGKDWEEVLQREEALVERFAAKGRRAPLAISTFVPSQRQLARNHAAIRQLITPPQMLQGLFAEAGFRDELAGRWLATMTTQPTPLTPETWLAIPLSTPYRHLALNSADGPASLLIPQDDALTAEFATLASGLAGVTAVDKAASVSQLFQQYRIGAAWWLPLAILLIALVLVLRYGLRNGAAILAPTVIGMGLALAVYGYAGQPLTLFSLMGLMLVLGVGANYAIFLFEAGDRAPAPFAGVLLSAATTLLAFGLLALSSMPALQHFGSMLLAGITASVLLAPLALVFAKPR